MLLHQPPKKHQSLLIQINLMAKLQNLQIKMTKKVNLNQKMQETKRKTEQTRLKMKFELLPVVK